VTVTATVTDEPPRRAADSRASLAILTRSEHTNAFGTVHGGVLLRLADEAGSLAALRHAPGRVVTTALLDSMTFLGPVQVGERLEAIAEVTYAGRTSMEVRIEVFAEPMLTFVRRRVAVGFGVWVALGPSGAPTPVPPLLIETDADRLRDDAARARQAHRLARRAESDAGR
jgi:uncharacterized protein (TIGR00369 family)